MTMLEFLERDKNKVIAELQTAASQEKAAKVIGDEVDRLLLLYNDECQLAARREAAADMLQVLRLSATLVDSAEEVWRDAGRGAVGKHVGSGAGAAGAGAAGAGISFLSRLLLGTGAACMLGGMWIAIFSDPSAFRPTDLLLAVILICGGGFLFWSAGRRYGRGSGNASLTGSTSGQYPEIHVDARRIYTSLHNAVYAIDRNLEQITANSGYGAGDGVEMAGGAAAGFGSGPQGQKLSASEVDLMAGLLEAAGSGDGNYALQKIADVKYFLHQHQIEAVDYNGSNGEWFDFMPSRIKRTIRPALICDGKVIRRGVAAGSR